MSYFPFMIELNNERCLIAGGGTVAYRKACSMLEFGAVVMVVSPEFCPELLELAEQMNTPDKYCAATGDDRKDVTTGDCKTDVVASVCKTDVTTGVCKTDAVTGDCKKCVEIQRMEQDNCGAGENFADYPGHLTLIKRCVQPQDIDDAFVVIMATDDEKVNHDMAELCRQQRILVNVVDVKSDCGFYFPAIIKDKEVVISVSTGGQSPVLAGTIKRNIESHLGRSYGDIAERMGELREQIKAQIDGEEERKKAFQQMVRSLLDES